jgi:predicted glutamine amidotransferase
MCRLLGFVSHRPTTLARLLGADLDPFTELSLKHGDGWGVATPAGPGVAVRKSTEAARRSPEFGELARGLVTDAALVHLRWATLGLPTTWDNAHPFTDGRIALAHNGSIAPPAALDDLIAPDLLGLRRGDTDSERYFLVLLTQLRQHPDTADALAATVSQVQQVAHSSLNALVLTPDALHAVCSYTTQGEAEAEEDGYYRMSYTQHDSAVVVSSSGWDEDGTDLVNGTMLSVRLDTGAVTVRALASHDAGVRPATA